MQKLFLGTLYLFCPLIQIYCPRMATLMNAHVNECSRIQIVSSHFDGFHNGGADRSTSPYRQSIWVLSWRHFHFVSFNPTFNTMLTISLRPLWTRRATFVKVCFTLTFRQGFLLFPYLVWSSLLCSLYIYLWPCARPSVKALFLVPQHEVIVKFCIWVRTDLYRISKPQPSWPQPSAQRLDRTKNHLQCKLHSISIILPFGFDSKGLISIWQWMNRALEYRLLSPSHMHVFQGACVRSCVRAWLHACL